MANLTDATYYKYDPKMKVYEQTSILNNDGREDAADSIVQNVSEDEAGYGR